MDITLVSSPNTFAAKVEGLLMKKEACNNLMLGLLNRLLHDEASYMEYNLGLVEQNGKVVFAFMQTPPNNWILADVDRLDDRVISLVTNFINEKGLNVPGVLGPVRLTNAFAQEYEQLTDTSARVHMEQLIYQLDEVNDIPRAGGKLIEATETHHSLITQWLVQFSIEANETITEEHAEQTAKTFISKCSVYLWEVDNKVVSMANVSRKTKHGATINAVFTPDEYKRKGYATSAVAELSKKILNDGFQFCSLYTDEANPTSNSIYKKIGYYVVGDSIVYKFNK